MRLLGRLALLAPLVFAGCMTEVAFRNEVPQATIENPRWITGDHSYPENDNDYESVGALAPGETSSGVDIYRPEDEGGEGVIAFDLVANGRRVALVTTKLYRAATGDSTTFTIDADTPTTNPLTDSK